MKVNKVLITIFGLFLSLSLPSVASNFVPTTNYSFHTYNEILYNSEITSILSNQNSSLKIRLDISRLANLHPKSIEQRNIYHFPDTVVIYSVGQNPKRYIYFYSQQSNLLSTLTQSLQNNQWVNSAMELNIYDNFGRKTTTTSQVWQNGNWQNIANSSYTYNSNGNVLSQITQLWIGSSWVNSDKVTNSYDISGNRVAFLSEKWISNSWSNLAYELYFYDQTSNLISGIRQVWANNLWINDQQYLYNYDANRNLLNLTIQSWVNNIWTNFYKESYIYNLSNKPVEYIGQFWQNNNWVFAEKYSYSYDALGYVQNAVGQIWQSNQWVNQEKGQFSYNNFGGVALSLHELWINNSWSNKSLLNCTYDVNGNAITTDLYSWNGTTWVQNQDGLLELFYSNSINTLYFVGYKASASYTSLLVRLDSQESIPVDFTFAPNPAKDNVIITFNSALSEKVIINLISSKGATVARLYGGYLSKGKSTFNLSTFEYPAGIYLVQVISESYSDTKKLIIK